MSKVQLKSGKEINVSNLVDAQKLNYFSVVSLHGEEAKLSIVHSGKDGKVNGYPYTVRDEDSKIIGFVSKESLEGAGLVEFVEKAIAKSPRNKAQLPISKIETVAPYALQNNTDHIHHNLNNVLGHIKDMAKGKEEIAASALLRSSTGQGIALKIFPAEIGKHLDQVPTIDIYAANDIAAQKDALIRFDNAKVDGNVRPIASLIAADGTVTALGITNNDSPTLAPGTVVRADISAISLDPKLRIQISGKQAIDGGTSKAIGVIPPEGFEYKEILPTTEQFEFRQVDIKGKREYQVYAQSELLGTVEKSSQARAASMAGKAVTGEYSRGQYTGKNQNGGLKMNVTALVEHQPVSREVPVISLGDGKGLVWSVAPVHQPVGRVGEVAVPDMYQPSRGELLRWYEVADVAQDVEAKELVLATGKQLAAEFQATGEGQVPPRDYSHASVVVSEGVREQMERMVEELVIVVTPDIVVTPTMVVTPTIVVKTDKSQEFDR